MCAYSKLMQTKAFIESESRKVKNCIMTPQFWTKLTNLCNYHPVRYLGLWQRFTVSKQMRMSYNWQTAQNMGLLPVFMVKMPKDCTLLRMGFNSGGKDRNAG